MLRTLILLMIIFMLTSCGSYDRVSATVTGQPTKACVDGVSYLQFTSGASVQLDQNGKIVVCK